MPVVVAGALLGTGSAEAGLPSGTTAVPVTAGATHSGIDAGLTRAASISGTITAAATHKAVGSALVSAYDSAGHAVGLPGFSDSAGKYQIKGLPASPSGYAVCVSAYSAKGGGVRTGYLGRCYKNVAWSGGAVPKAANRVKLATGQQAGGINVALPSGAAISGTVRSTSGAALNSVYVQLRNRATGARYYALTGKTGGYIARSLPPTSKGYQVCFDGRGSTTRSARGFLTQCFRKVAWTGGAFPRKATAVSVAAGRTHTGVSGKLAPGGAVAGNVVDARTGAAVANASVRVLSKGGSLLGEAPTNKKGQYVVKGLFTAKADRVCVAAKRVSATVTYGGRCYKNVAWSGGRPSRSAKPVAVKVGHTTSKINLRPVKSVIKLGSIAGTITEQAGRKPLQYANVQVFSSAGGYVTSTSTDAAGHYKVGGLRASSTGYVVCAEQPGFSIDPVMPATGWASRCYKGAAWTGGKPPSGAT
ncbi:MAG TPA: carboxypeptidase-like regulatory domain-containing protein, partial [Jatrophihabitans sp.]|nr:carboxypeptidase-like regulatory domain-containing protein [Jatrophihabitans sp.]